MKISQVVEILDAAVLAGETLLDGEIRSACGSDMMSDVLAYVRDQGVLLSGLVNSQVIRTALMMDISCIVFVRGKTPSAEMLTLAEGSGIVVLKTDKTMYESCGRLYLSGLGR